MIKSHSLPGLSYTRTIKFFSLRPISAQGDFSWERATLSWPVHISKVPLYALRLCGGWVQTAVLSPRMGSHMLLLPCICLQLPEKQQEWENSWRENPAHRSHWDHSWGWLCLGYSNWCDVNPDTNDGRGALWEHLQSINEKMLLHQTHYLYEKSRSNYTRNSAIEPLLDDWQCYFLQTNSTLEPFLLGI